jgi:hypothetical protein
MAGFEKDVIFYNGVIVLLSKNLEADQFIGRGVHLGRIRNHQRVYLRFLYWLKRTSPLRLCLYFSLAIALRVILYRNFPIVITNDSEDYLIATGSIIHSLDFFSKGLRDARLPGYPVFLALTYPLTGMLSHHIVLIQVMVGLASIFLGLAIGSLLRSRLITEGLVLFLSINPVYLLSEHMLLTETFYLFTLLGFITVALVCLRGKLNWLTGLFLGLAFGINLLTRANGILLCIVVILGICVIGFKKYRRFPTLTRPILSSQGIGLELGKSFDPTRLNDEKAGERTSLKRSYLGFMISLGLATMFVVGPWIWRNYVLFGTISLVNYNNRNLLVYKLMHDHLDSSLPYIHEVNQSFAMNEVDYHWLFKLSYDYPTDEAERIAGEVYWEQIRMHLDLQIQDMRESLQCFVGYCPGVSNDRVDLRNWFSKVINNPAYLHTLNTRPWLKSDTPDFTYIEYGADIPLLHLWSAAGNFYLIIFRPFLVILFIILGVLYLVYHAYKRSWRPNHQTYAIVLLSLGYLATILLHVVTLADIDRFAVSFDIIPFTVILLVASLLIAQVEN